MVRCIQLAAIATLSVLVMGCSKGSEEVSGAQASAAQRQEIQAAFSAYRAALVESDASKIQAAATAESVALFERVRDLAASGSAGQIASQPLAVQMMVGSLRVRHMADSLSAMTTESVLQEAIRQGWVNPQTVINAELHEITVDGSKALAIFKVDDDRVDEPWLFINEDGAWKVDMTGSINAIDRALEQSLEDSQLTRDEFIIEALRDVLKRPVSRSIWQAGPDAKPIPVSITATAFVIDPKATDVGLNTIKSILSRASVAGSTGGRLSNAQQTQLWAALDKAVAAGSAQVFSKPTMKVLSGHSAQMGINSPTLSPSGVTMAKQDLYLSVDPLARPNGTVVLEYAVQTKNVNGRFSVLMDQAGLPIAARAQGAGAGAVSPTESLFLLRPYADKELILVIGATQASP